MLIDREKAFVIAVDYQERLLPAMRDTRKLLDNSVKLLTGVKALGVPVVYTQQYTKGLGPTISCIRDVIGSDTYGEKLKYSCYECLEGMIPSPEERPFVIICGIEAHCCVLQTAIEMQSKGYRAVLVTDCISSRKEADEKYAIERAKQEGVLLTTYEAILFELLRKAGTDTAKVIQKLIR